MDNSDSIQTTRRQKLQSKAVPRSRFSLPPGIKTQMTESEAQDDGQSTPLSPPGIYSASSQDSTHTTNSVASRRQRIMAISAKNKAHRRSYTNPSTTSSPKVKDTENDVDSIGSNNKNHEKAVGRVKPPSWQSPQSKNASRRVPPEPIDTQYNNNDPSSNGRASPLPPPPPLPDTHNSASQARDVEHANEHANRIKSWSEREQKGGRVVAFPSPTNWKGRSESPSSARQQRIGNRVVVAQSPTASIGSVESSFSAQPRNIAKKNSWNNNTRPNVSSKVNASPEVNRSFSSPKYGSPQPRYSTGNKNSIEPQRNVYKNLLKPVQKEPEVKKSHEKEAYGAIIETPEKSSVSSLHAMFDSQNAVPLMPMNSTNSSVRHSLPIGSPVTPSSVKTGGAPSRYRSSAGRSNVRNSFEEYANSSDAVGSSFTDDRSVSSARSSSSGNRPRQPVVSSWIPKQYAAKNEQQHNGNFHSASHNVRNKSFLPSKTVPKDNKSRVRQYYNSSWRMESPVHEKSESKVSTDTRENNENDLSQETEGQELNSHKDGDDEFKPANLKSSWQQRCRPKPIEIDAPESPIPSTDVKGTQIKVKARKSVEPSALSASALVSLMYSTKNKKSDEDNQNTLRATMDWPCDTTEKETDVEDNVTDIILDSLTDIIPNDIELPPTVDPAPDKDNNTLTTEVHPSQEALQGGTALPSSGVKPWENDTKHSVVQSWQNRPSKPKDSCSSAPSVTEESEQSPKNETEGVAASSCGDVAPEDQIVGNTVEEVTNDTKNQSELLKTNSSSDSYIEEKKSNDLSFDEDEILGQDIDGRLSQSKVSSVESSQHGDQSTHHTRKQSFYDDDSYLSRGGDTDTRGLCQSESILTASARSRTSATYNSEDMSLYVEDERIISKKEDKILSAQFEQMNLEVAVGESEVKVEEKKEEKKEETIAPALTINVDSIVRPNLPRLNPSPKDCDEYRSRFFDDSGGPTAKSIRDIRRKKHEDNRYGHEDSSNKNSTPVSGKNDVDSVQTKKSSENQLFDVWACTSNEERDEAIKFDETDQWLDRDPDIEDSVIVDDVSESSEQENAHGNCVEETPKPDPEPRPIFIKKPPQSLRTLQKQHAKALINNAKKAKQQQPKQEVFDPFGIDAEETDGLTVEISDDLFSSNPDPFMTAESFSPLEWSTPSGSNTNSNTNKDNAHSQHIGYYNSPDSRVEI
jgi:hypothetical protein